ncbi:MAG: T9SS type A sorting domain-containing protein [Bacteroidales bacterium]|nr:T9SS type A sorting domain-containing protein [Bacteroidales bacterium]
MKKISLICVLSLLAYTSNAQQQEYDTLIYFPQEIIGCPTAFDTSIFEASILMYSFKYECIHGVPPSTRPMGDFIGCNTYYPEGFAQHYNFDSTLLICGLAARVYGEFQFPDDDKTYFFHLMNSDLSESMASASITHSVPDSLLSGSPNVPDAVLKNYYFGHVVSISDFFLSVDIPSNWSGASMSYNHTYSFIDTVCLNQIVGCQYSEHPWIKKNGEWKSFVDDTVYEVFRNMFIEFLPVILIPKEDTTTPGSLQQINLDNTCSVSPNPTSESLTIISQFKVSNVEIYNAVGVKVKEQAVNAHEAKIDVKGIPAGNYVVKLSTPRGTATKKFVKK